MLKLLTQQMLLHRILIYVVVQPVAKLVSAVSPKGAEIAANHDQTKLIGSDFPHNGAGTGHDADQHFSGRLGTPLRPHPSNPTHPL